MAYIPQKYIQLVLILSKLTSKKILQHFTDTQQQQQMNQIVNVTSFFLSIFVHLNISFTSQLNRNCFLRACLHFVCKHASHQDFISIASCCAREKIMGLVRSSARTYVIQGYQVIFVWNILNSFIYFTMFLIG